MESNIEMKLILGTLVILGISVSASIANIDTSKMVPLKHESETTSLGEAGPDHFQYEHRVNDSKSSSASYVAYYQSNKDPEAIKKIMDKSIPNRFHVKTLNEMVDNTSPNIAQIQSTSIEQ